MQIGTTYIDNQTKVKAGMAFMLLFVCTGLFILARMAYINNLTLDVSEDDSEGSTNGSLRCDALNAPEGGQAGHCKTSYAECADSAHFNIGEFVCKDGSIPPKTILGNVQELMDNLEIIREAAGGAAIHINSGYRSPAHNKKVGGETRSMHLCGMAADITIKGKTAKQVHSLILDLIKQGKIHDGGVGEYATFTHYDVGNSRRWKK
jgi:hypothetical protein